MDVPGRPEPVHPDQLILCLWRRAHRGQHLCRGRPGHRFGEQNSTNKAASRTPGSLKTNPCFPVCTGTSFDYIREFRRSTGTWHRTKPMLPTDLSRTVCAALRFANCKLFRLQLNQGMFRIRVWPWRRTHAAASCLLWVWVEGLHQTLKTP